MSRSLPPRLAIVGLLVLLLLTAWSLRRSPSFDAEAPSTDSPSARRAARAAGHSLGGIQAVAMDPAEPPLRWVREGEDVTPPEAPAPIYALAKDDESLEELMGLLEWALPLGQHGAAGLEMAQCAARFEPELESPCGWDIEAVLRRQLEDTGVIVYAQAVVNAGREQPACRALASCSTEAWARREPVPMPSRLGDELHFSQGGRNSFWFGGRGIDAPTYYRNASMNERRAFDELAAVPHDPIQISPASIGWNLAFFQHRIDEYECMLDVLEERPGACGS